MITAKELGRRAAAHTVKEAAGGMLLPQVGEGLVGLIRALGGKRLYAQLVGSKGQTAANNVVGKLKARAAAPGLNGIAPAFKGKKWHASRTGSTEIGQRIGHAEGVAGLRRQERLGNIGALGLGLGGGALLASGQEEERPPRGYPGYPRY